MKPLVIITAFLVFVISCSKKNTKSYTVHIADTAYVNATHIRTFIYRDGTDSINVTRNYIDSTISFAGLVFSAVFRLNNVEVDTEIYKSFDSFVLFGDSLIAQRPHVRNYTTAVTFRGKR